MTQDEIIEMAVQAGWSGIYTQWAEPTGEADWSPFKVSLTVPVTMQQIEAFVKLVAAKEREAIEKLFEELSDNTEPHKDYEDYDDGWVDACYACKLAVTARGEQS